MGKIIRNRTNIAKWKVIIMLKLCPFDIGDLNKIIQEINMSRNKDLINRLLVVECLTDSKNLIKEIMANVCEIDFSNLKDIEPGKIQEKKDNMYNEILMRFYE